MTYRNIVGVQFRRAGKIFDFLPGELNLVVGDHVVVDTERGASLARVVRVNFADDVAFAATPLKPVMRKASDGDLRETSDSAIDEALKVARSRVDHFGLNMRILKAEGQFGGNKFTVYFSAPGRVDFRDLVKDLASALRARVELKQVGSRDEAKLVGGLGICGREYCCSSFLRDFVPVSIKMAKNQNLALNPNKVSGGCGRLLCCLTYENDAYIDLRSKLPPLKSRVRSIEEGISGVIIKTDVLNQLIVIETGDGRQVTYKAKDVEIVERSEIKSDDMDTTEAESWGEDLDLANLVSDQKKSGQGNNSSQTSSGGPRNQQGGSRDDRNSRPQNNRPQGGKKRP
ncbi:MAG: regulatory iron-sulfur-containing complex subunit RicT [Proteobacteria bacterium]|nr:regulatory iron-sulfur-containing complex subunit RicT [Pseudomonadota bacterium]